MDLNLGQTLSLKEAGEALGVDVERVRQRVQKGALTGRKNAVGHWEVDIDGRFQELAELTRMKRLTRKQKIDAASAPETDPNAAPSAQGTPETGPEEPFATASVEAPSVEPKRSSSRGEGMLGLGGSAGGGTVRTDAFTPYQIERGVVIGFGAIASVRQRPWWAVDPAEVKPWSAEAAQLMNTLPLPFVQAAVSMSSVGIVMGGLFAIVYGRLAIDKAHDQSVAEQQAVQGAETFLSERQYAEAMRRGAGASAPPPTQRAAGPVGPAQPHPVGGDFFPGL